MPAQKQQRGIYHNS